MIADKLTPKIIIYGLITQTVISSVIFALILLGVLTDDNNFNLYFPIITNILVYFTAAVINFSISFEHKENALMRWSWIFLGLNAFVSVFREVISLPFLGQFWSGYTDFVLREEYHRVIILIANSCLLLGLLGIWWSFQQVGLHKVGLGFVIKRRDYLEIFVIFLLALALFFTVYASPAGLMILSASAMVSIIIYRMAMQMGGGKLAISLRLLTLYTLMRGILVLVEHFLSIYLLEQRQTLTPVLAFDFLFWRAIPWLAALAAAYRFSLAHHATEEIMRHRKSEGVSAAV